MKPPTVLAVSLALLVCLAMAASPRGEYEAPYSGPPLPSATKDAATIICESSLAGSTGYYRTGDETTAVSSFKKQKDTVAWKISIQHDHAEVIDSQLNKNDFIVVKRETDGLALVFVETGASTQIITIDPRNSSFVYTTQHVHSLWNRASTFVGSCY